MRPALPRRGVDLVEHAPGIRDVEEAVLGKRGRFDEFPAIGAGKRHCIGELEPLDVILIDAGERREALAVIGAVVHQPVLRLLVGIEEPLRRHVGSERRRRQHAGCEQSIADRKIVPCHNFLPFLNSSVFLTRASNEAPSFTIN
jgi:hypothetical protein